MIIFNRIPQEKNQIKTKTITHTTWDNLSTEARIKTTTLEGRILGGNEREPPLQLTRFVMAKHKNSCVSLFNMLQDQNNQYSVEMDQTVELENIYNKN